MNRNHFLPHIALALVLILVAAFAGQLRRWQGQLKHRARIMPASDKQRTPVTTEDVALGDPREFVSPEIMVKFKPGVTKDAIDKITITDIPETSTSSAEKTVEISAPSMASKKHEFDAIHMAKDSDFDILVNALKHRAVNAAFKQI